MEELQLQTALDKAELNDKFEKKTREKYQSIKTDIYSTIQKDIGNWSHLNAKFEHLELQFS